MTLIHHQLAHITTESILKKFKEGDWKCPGDIGTNFVRTGVSSSFPSPDAGFYDDGNKFMVLFEFKPPTEGKRGILTGLGQSVAYLDSCNISYLIIPKKLETGFELEDYMKKLFSDLVGNRLPIGLIVFDNDNPSEVSMIHKVEKMPEEMKEKKFKPNDENSNFWAKWQDLPISLFHLILHCYYLKKIGQVEGDAYAHCWKEYMFKPDSLETLEPTVIIHPITKEEIKTPAERKNMGILEDTLKKVKSLSGVDRVNAITKLREKEPKSMVEWKKNHVTFLKHLGMVDSTGNLTDFGFKYYHLGLTHGSNSKKFRDYFLKCVLETGRHLDLIFDIETLCNKYKDKKTTGEIVVKMEKDYEDKGMIKRNEPRQVGEESTVPFLKYEFILWNSLDAKTRTKGKPDISFNWQKITEVISLPEL